MGTIRYTKSACPNHTYTIDATSCETQWKLLYDHQIQEDLLKTVKLNETLLDDDDTYMYDHHHMIQTLTW